MTNLFEKGCLDCKHLRHDDKIEKLWCAKIKWIKLENGGGFVEAVFNTKVRVPVENCLEFEGRKV